MASKIINLTLLKLTNELDSFLEIYPNQLYQKILTDPELRLELIAYVLNRIPNRYKTVAPDNARSIASHSIMLCAEEGLRLENLIHQGIYSLTPKKSANIKSFREERVSCMN